MTETKRAISQEHLPVWVGIDLGTTYSSLAMVSAVYTQNGYLHKQCNIATDRSGVRTEQRFVPSDVCVYFEDNTIKWAFGEEAINKAKTYGKAAHLFPHGYKLQIGEDISVCNDIELIDENGNCKILNYNSAEIAQKLVEYLRKLALNNSLAGRQIMGVSISVPALWPPDRKKIVEELVVGAGFDNNLDIQAIEEPIAAIYHHIDNCYWLYDNEEIFVMVIDYGGGTCNVAIIKIYQNANELILNNQSIGEVVGRGCLKEGGMMIDKLICANLQKDNDCFNIFDETWQLYESEKIKISFSNQLTDYGFPPRDDIMLNYVIHLPDNINLPVECTSATFKSIINPQIEKIQIPIAQALNNASVEMNLSGQEFGYKNISMVFLTGGTSLIPFVKQTVFDLFAKNDKSIEIEDELPRLAIVYGVAKHAFHNQTHIGPGFSVVLKDNIYLEGSFGLGHLLAMKGTHLPHMAEISIDRWGWFDSFEINLYKGKSKILSRDETMNTSSTIINSNTNQKWKLKKPYLHARITIQIKLRSSGTIQIIMNIKGESPFTIDRYVPVQSDFEAMQERTENHGDSR